MCHKAVQNWTLDNDLFEFTQKPLDLPPIFPGNPLSWMSLFSKDVYLTALCAVKLTNNRSPIKLSNMNLDSNDDDFLQKWRGEDVDKSLDFLPISIRNGGNNTIFKEVHNDIDDLSEVEFINKLKECLKDFKLVWLLIDRFFNTELFVSMPYLNKDDFIDSIEKIIGQRKNGVITLRLNNTLDLPIIGILLVLIRLSTASLYNFEKKLYPYSDRPNDIKYMIDNPISKDILLLIDKLRKEVKKLLINYTSLEIFQFLLMVEYFDIFEPETCDCVKTPSSLNLSKLLKYASRCSLNRDPDVYTYDFPMSGKSLDKELSRRLWWGLVGLDLYQFVMIGNPRIIESKFYDTKHPTLDPEDEVNYILNKSIRDQVHHYLSNIEPTLNIMLALQPKATFTKMKKQQQILRKRITSMKTLHEIAFSPCDTVFDRCENIKNFTFLISYLSLDFLIDYHFFLKYNTKKDYNQSFEYLISCIETFNKLLEAFVLFIDPQNSRFNLQRVFGSGILVFPKLESTMHRTIVLPFTILSRFRFCCMLNEDLLRGKSKLFDRIFNSLNRLFMHNLNLFLKLSKVYYHVWIIAKVHGFLMVQVLETFRERRHNDLDKFATYMEDHIANDEGFIQYDEEHLEAIANKLEISSKICEFTDDYTDDFLFDEFTDFSQAEQNNEPTSNIDLILQNDKKWRDRMLKEYNGPLARTANENDTEDKPLKRFKVSDDDNIDTQLNDFKLDLNDILHDESGDINTNDSRVLQSQYLDILLNSSFDTGFFDDFFINNAIFQNSVLTSKTISQVEQESTE